jgi:acyl-CoA hydrolase
MLRPTRPGPILLRLVGQGAFAATVQTRIVQVTAPVPRIEIERPVQSGEPGTAVTFRWRITGAREAHIDAPVRGETYGVALDGGMVVDIEPTAEEFHLVAIGLDGRRHTERFSTIPRLIACLDEP